MTEGKVLVAVTQAAVAEGGCKGVDHDPENIDAFLKSGKPGSDEGLYVSGIAFSHFYGFSPTQFDAGKASLWQAISEKIPQTVSEPSGWDMTWELGQMASALYDQL